MTKLALHEDRVKQVLSRGGVVKICGLREPAHAAVAAAAGADLIGFIFAPARRQVSAAVARQCISAARNAAGARDVLAVGVFVDAPGGEMAAVADETGLDVLQLHGQEPFETLAALNRPVIKALRPRPGERVEQVLTSLSRYRNATKPPIAFLLDGYSPNALGGTGHRTDWQLAAAVCTAQPILLGGGLDAGNAAEAIGIVKPLGVDVSSGVETDDTKDPAKIEAFIAAARLAFRN